MCLVSKMVRSGKQSNKNVTSLFYLFQKQLKSTLMARICLRQFLSEQRKCRLTCWHSLSVTTPISVTGLMALR